MATVSSDVTTPITQVPVTSTDTANQPTSTTSTADAASSSEFDALLADSLGLAGDTQVNEEELFAAIIGQKLSEESEEANVFYQDKIKEFSVSMARSDGYIPLEDVAKEALKATVDAGMVAEDKAEMINATAFAAAQLDEDKDCLFDGRGETCALGSMEEAMFKVQAVLDQIEAGTLVLEARSLDIPSNVGFTPGHLVDAEGETAKVEGAVESKEASKESSEKQVRFTWKEEANDGNLAILLPTRLNGSVDSVSIWKDGELVEEGSYDRQTGDKRAIFRFDEPGAAYGEDLDVKVEKDDGETLVYHIDNGAERTYHAQDDYSVEG